MPRGARHEAPGTLHHVMMRGIEQGSIVRDDSDRAKFLRRMGLFAKTSGGKYLRLCSDDEPCTYPAQKRSYNSKIRSLDGSI